jgi:glycosyltransferase involved in cell wall biosynthesis
MVPKKGIVLLLDAFRRAGEQEPELRLDVVGAGELFPAAQQFVQAMGLSDRVTLHGEQPFSRVRELLAEADIFLHHAIVDPVSGDEEGLPVAVLEAMASAVPVVATRHAGIPEAVADEETGLLSGEADTTAMARNILRLARDPGLRRGMGEAGWERARRQFSWERERRELLQLLGLDQGADARN